MRLIKKIGMIDAEAVGLFGEVFAVSLVLVDPTVYDKTGNPFSWRETMIRTWAVSPTEEMGTQSDYDWVMEHVTLPKETIWCDSLVEMRSLFWRMITSLKEEGMALFGDTVWPVETNLLTKCVQDDPSRRTWEGPYPLLDLASMAPFGNPPEEWLPQHLPKHNPENDARHSMRQLLHVLATRWEHTKSSFYTR